MSALDDIKSREQIDSIEESILVTWDINGYEHLAELAANKLADLRARIAELEALTTWQPIEAIPIETPILVLYPKDTYSRVQIIKIPEYLKDTRNYHEIGWMPLPKPPEEK